MPDRVTTGSVVDGFLVGRRLHAGAMGNIFEVTKPGLDGRMVMKLPRVGVNEPPEGVIGFEIEATIVPALSGSHVPHAIAVGDLAVMPYLVTEWIEGTPLDEILANGPLPEHDVARIGAAIADALHSIHEQECVHLDLKPANVILKPDGTAALVDFGFACHARFPDLLAEETRFSAGSRPYVSPEQVQGRRDDRRSDIFALGVVMYEMLTGRFPFGEPDTDVRNRLWVDPAPPPCEPWLREIILRCLEARAEDRYQSAAHVAFDLRNPEQVVLTHRARKTKRASVVQHVKRFLQARRDFYRRGSTLAKHSPIIMVAVDTLHLDDERQPAIQRATEQLISLSDDYRLICVSVIPSGPIMESPQESASRLHLDHLRRLRAWVDPLKLPPQRISLHAIESETPAQALLEFANRNHVDLIIVGAPGPTHPERTWWQSVASTVTANARCSVHVVRVG